MVMPREFLRRKVWGLYTLTTMAVSRKDLFLPLGGLPVDLSQARSEYVTVTPSGGSVAGSTDVEFIIPASSRGFIDLANSYIVTRVPFRDWYDPSAAGDPAGVSAINAWRSDTAPEEGAGDSIWRSLSMYMGSTDVSDSAPNLYPYASYFRNSLTRPASWVQGGLQRVVTLDETVNDESSPADFGDMHGFTTASPAGWGAEMQGWALYSKATGSTGTSTGGSGLNRGSSALTPYESPSLALRQSLAANNQGTDALVPNIPLCELVTIPNLGIWKQRDYIPANIDIRLTLAKSSSAFCTHARETLALVATPPGPNWDDPRASCRLFLKRVYPTPAMQTVFDQQTIERPLRYNCLRSRMATYNIDRGVTNVSAANLLTGFMPDVVIVQFVHAAAFKGEYQRCPFGSIDVMQHRAAGAAGAPAGAPADLVSSIQVTWGGRQYPLAPIRATSIDDCAEAYAAYVAATDNGNAFGDETPMLTYSAFRAGRRMFCFQLNASEATAGTEDRSYDDRGSLEVNATIDRAGGTVSEDSIMLVCGFANATVLIDSTRAVSKVGF